MPNVDAVLVDTHALLWWQAGGDRLSSTAALRIEQADVVYLSPITCWEIAMLVTKGRVALDRPVGAWISDLLATGPCDIADLTPAIAVTAGQLENFHGDPADRIIYATAVTRQLPLLTKDTRLRDRATTGGEVAGVLVVATSVAFGRLVLQAAAMLVAVVGAGIGGLAAALALRRAGLDVEVHEQAPNLGEVGAGIQISPNASRVLHRLGLAEALDRVAVRPRTGDLRRWQDWSLITSQPLGDRALQDYGFPYYHLHRADLHGIFVRAVAAEGIVVHLGQRVVGVDATGHEARLRFEDGGEALADVVVGADGIHSAVRTSLFGPEAPRFSGMSVWRGLVPATDVADLQLAVASTAVLGPGQHFVHYFVSAGRLVNWVGVAPTATWTLESWTTPGRLEDALADFAGWSPVVLRLIAAAVGPDRADTLYRWALYDRDPMTVWSDGPVTLLGDAAHPMLPFMAQGAAQAIEDAAVLATCLQRVGGAAAALRTYEDLRRPRTAQVQLAARRNEETFHLPDGPAQQERDRRLGAASGDQAGHRNAWVFEYDPAVATAHL